MYIKFETRALDFAEGALNGNGSQVLEEDGSWLGSSSESDNAHSAGKESGCQMKSGIAGDGSLVSTLG
jgi:hypothetical protein